MVQRYEKEADGLLALRFLNVMKMIEKVVEMEAKFI